MFSAVISIVLSWRSVVAEEVPRTRSRNYKFCPTWRRRRCAEITHPRDITPDITPAPSRIRSGVRVSTCSFQKIAASWVDYQRMVIGYCRAYQTTSCQIFSMMDNFRGNYFHGLSHVFSNALIYTYTGEHSVMADCRTILTAIQSLGAALLLMLCLSLPSRPSSSEGWRQQLTIPVSSSSIASRWKTW